jgi:hypothetical protein
MVLPSVPLEVVGLDEPAVVPATWAMTSATVDVGPGPGRSPRTLHHRMTPAAGRRSRAARVESDRGVRCGVLGPCHGRGHPRQEIAGPHRAAEEADGQNADVTAADPSRTRERLLLTHARRRPEASTNTGESTILPE